MNKGDLMKLVYTKKELQNIDSGIPKEYWKGHDTSTHVMNYNGSSAFGEFENMIHKKTLDGRTIVKFKQWLCSLHFGKYPNGITAMYLKDLEDGEPVATCTVNVMEHYGILAPMGHVIIKEYSDNIGMTQALIDSKIIDEIIYQSIPIGYGDCIIKTCKLIIDIPKEITYDDVLNLLPDTTSLIYVDRNESFDDHQDILQNVITNNNYDLLHEKISDWYLEHELNSVDAIIKELSDELQIKYKLTEEQCEDIIEEHRDSITDKIYERSDDTTFEDLLRNTSTIIAHYDTGYEMAPDSWNWTNAKVKTERVKMKKFLSIKRTNHDYDDSIDIMIRQATYGGNLLIYFNLDFDELDKSGVEIIKSIQFENAHIGIIDHFNGSGDITDLPRHSFSVPFDRENLFLEKSIKYNWTYSIAGMCHDWCDSTSVKYLKDNIGVAEKSPTIQLQKNEEIYNAAYKLGICSYGDMDINRHRKTTYKNDIPCGNHCGDCGTFWID